MPSEKSNVRVQNEVTINRLDEATNSLSQGYAAARSNSELRELRLKAKKLGMTGYEKLSKGGLKMFIADVIEHHGQTVSPATHKTRMTVKALRLLCRNKGLRGYSNLRKANLIALLRNSNPLQKSDQLQQTGLLLDEPVPNINVNILQPTAAPAQKRKACDRFKKNLSTLGKKIKSEACEFSNWLVKYIPSPMKTIVSNKVGELITKVNNIFNTVYKNVEFKNVKPQRKFEVQTAICGYVQKYTINGDAGYDAKSFLDDARPQVVDLLTENRQVKVHCVLTCSMERFLL